MKIIDQVPQKVKILTTRVCEPFILKLCSDGILYVHISSRIDYNVESLKRLNEEIGEMVNYRKTPILATLDEFSMPSAETRVYWAKKDSCSYASAEAFITGNVGHKLIGNIYLRFNKPERPTKIFTKMDEAIAWLSTFA